MINTKLENRTELWSKLGKLGLVYKLRKILGPTGGYRLRSEDGLFVPKNSALEPLTPWVHVKQVPESKCGLYHHVFFNVLEHIHSHCRSCWKIVVRPRTLVELFDLYELQKEMDVASKCGIEPRETVNGLYGGYFYTRSKEQGLERYEQVRKAVNKHISRAMPVILKRYCTEFEIGASGGGEIKGKGPSDKVGDVTPEEREMEIYIEAHFPDQHFASLQPEHLVASTMQTWIKWAYQHGDLTWQEFTDKPFLSSVITYHEGE